jgi:hypothetical protein
MGIFIEPALLPKSGEGFCQLIFLLLVYGCVLNPFLPFLKSVHPSNHPIPSQSTNTHRYILKNASHMISEGSELLLLVPALAGVVGSVVLPVLGAVPDGAIVLFSGMGENAQEELTVGVGALAGSTIFLLTIPWALSIVGGRVHVDPVSGLALYRYVRSISHQEISNKQKLTRTLSMHTGGPPARPRPGRSTPWALIPSTRASASPRPCASPRSSCSPRPSSALLIHISLLQGRIGTSLTSLSIHNKHIQLLADSTPRLHLRGQGQHHC